MNLNYLLTELEALKHRVQNEFMETAGQTEEMARIRDQFDHLIYYIKIELVN